MRLLIIDSNSMINRAFYGIRNLSARDGTPTNAVFGFFNILNKLTEQVKPDYICAAFDVKAPTFRHKQYAEYKAQRKPMPDDLARQIPIAKEILDAMNIPVLELAGYEADDIIGTVSRVCSEQGVECYIATGDKDDLQLADANVRVMLTVTRSGVNDTVIYDDKAVFERFGVTPTEFIDVKALMGDPSDNIPGVAGIGEKTALKLISQHHSIEYIYEHIDEIGLKGAAYKKVSEGRESAFMSKELATIDRNVPMKIDIEEYKATEADNDRLYNVLKRLDLHNLIKKYKLTPPSETAPESDIFENAVMTDIHDLSELTSVIESARDNKRCAVSIAWADKRIESVAVAVGKNAYCVRAAENIAEGIRPLLTDGEIAKYVYDIKDTLVKLHGVYGENIVENIAFDAAIALYLINPSRAGYELESVAEEYLGAVIDTDDVDGQISLFDDRAGVDYERECKRVLCIEPLSELAKQKMEQLGQHDLYYEVELPLIQVLADMQIYGFKIDTRQLKEFGEMLGARIDKLSGDIYEYAGGEFNINSPKQLGGVLFEKLGLKAGRKTKKGYSTNAEVLEKLQGDHPIVPLIMEYRRLAKLKSTYCDGLAAVINPETGRIHSVFTQTVTVTGRISSTEPNMQNIPTRTELGREIRKMFIAQDENYTLTDADYSQIELRVLAHIANDSVMISAFNSGEDIHTACAAQVFGVPLSEVTSEQRRHAKAINFGIVYGIGEFSLSQDLKITVGEAKQYIAGYLEKYSGVREYMEEIKQRAKRDGYVKTVMNRIRYIPELASSNKLVRAFGERVALNTPIQGSAADIIKLAMVRVHRRLKQEGLKSRLILQVHDELIVETYRGEEDAVKGILKGEMENVMRLRVPLTADMQCGRSWYDAK